MFEGCSEIRSYFSDYIDGTCSREALRSIRYHLESCHSCQAELQAWQTMRADLRALPRLEMPPPNSLSLRVRLSQEIHRNVLGRLLVRLENSLQPLLLPASVGALTAVICFSLIINSQPARDAHAPDVPLQFTPARVEALAPIEFNTGDQAVVLVTNINSGGRAVDYKILSGKRSPDVTNGLDRMMVFSVFQPATKFGRPSHGQVVLSLRTITVKG
jgi:hypothetical protein